MKWFVMMFRRFADFSGRSGRKEFWTAWLFIGIVLFAFCIMPILLFYLFELPLFIYIAALLVLCLMFVMFLALNVRRLHDVGRPGWWLLVIFVPLFNLLLLFILAATEGEKGPNRYGEEPKAIN